MESYKLKIFSDHKKTIRDFLSKDYTYVSFDTETTGLKPKENHIIELGAVKFNKSGLIGEPFNKLIKPPVSIPFFITQITNITNEMVQDAKPAHEVVSEFLEYIGGEDVILVAHNAPFDMHFVNSELARCGKPMLKNHAIDTLRLERFFHPEYKVPGESGQYKLQSLAARYKINVKAAHRACDDARVCMEVFNHEVLLQGQLG